MRLSNAIELIHGRLNGSVDRSEAALLQVKKTFGPHCGLLVVNSRIQSGDMEESQTRLQSDLERQFRSSLHSLLASDPFMRLGVLLTDNIEVERDTTAVESAGHTTARLSEGFEDTARLASCMTSNDVAAIRSFLREFTSQSLVPWMEARVREWNEIYVSSRRGITGRLFGAGRKFFGSGRSTPTQNMVYNSIRG